MHRSATTAVLAATVSSLFAYAGCTNSSPNAPTGSSAPPASAIVIDVVGINGAQSFSPNPATVPLGGMVVWHNVDTVTHRVLFNDGELDTGSITPGSYSAAMSLLAPGPYHCSIHPPMVGRIARGQ